MEKSERKKSSSPVKIAAGGVSAIIIIFFVSLFTTAAVRFHQFSEIKEAAPLSQEELFSLNDLMLSRYPENFQKIKNLPYSIPEPKLDVYAESAILIDVSNGCLLYEKNADQVIPPASMTKLFALYVVDEEVAAGNLSYDQIIPLPPESWACNMPPHSSLMFLGEGQKVTLEELLLGLSVCSGNDAAYALAYTICGNIEDFVERMNLVASDMGLTHTHFVESSGYSEKNTTTAREMAVFAREYLKRHPDSLERYHGVPSFTYPKEKNLAPGDSLLAQDFSQGLPRHITMPITQKNTNPLLGLLEGCDGLKTGYIDESGYNLSLTAKRGQTRYLSVTMKGPGRNAAEGQAGRVHDGKELMEWAFYSFADYSIEDFVHPYMLKICGASQKSLNLIPSFSEKIVTVPYIYGDSMQANLDAVQVKVSLPDYLMGAVEQGEEAGQISVILGDYVLQTIPLIADREVKKSNWFICLADKIVFIFYNT
ncbi:MAG: D-alanyl-D-alanine carboxypeptidase [Treponema sp.]|nr:D-alanyl-D-alanine carboxypeptidase [Treponema sp.]